MTVIEEIEEKVGNYLETQPSIIQNNFDNIESTKEQIEFKVYLVKKILNTEFQIEDETIIFHYISKEECNFII